MFIDDVLRGFLVHVIRSLFTARSIDRPSSRCGHLVEGLAGAGKLEDGGGETREELAAVGEIEGTGNIELVVSFTSRRGFA